MPVIEKDGTILRGEQAIIENPYASLENWLYINGLDEEFECNAYELVMRWSAEWNTAELCGDLFAEETS